MIHRSLQAKGRFSILKTLLLIQSMKDERQHRKYQTYDLNRNVVITLLRTKFSSHRDAYQQEREKLFESSQT